VRNEMQFIVIEWQVKAQKSIY